MSRITAANGPILPVTTSLSGSAATSEARSGSVDSFEGSFPPLFSGSAADKTNWNLFQALQGGAVSGVSGVELMSFFGYTQQYPGLEIEFELGANIGDVVNSIISVYPEFADYVLIEAGKTWDILPKWIKLVERRPVATFRLDTV